MTPSKIYPESDHLILSLLPTSFEALCLDCCTSLLLGWLQQPPSQSLPYPTLPSSLSILKTAAREILSKYVRSCHSNLGQALVNIQGEHWNSCKAPCASFPFHPSSPTHLLLPVTPSFPAILGLCCSINTIGLLCLGTSQGSSFCLPCSSCTFPSSWLPHFLQTSLKMPLYQWSLSEPPGFRSPCAPFKSPLHHSPYSIIFLLLVFIAYCLSTPF